MKFYYVRESFVDPEFEFKALEHKFHTECSKLKLDVTKDVFKKIASGLDRDRYDMIRRRRELNDIFAKGTDAEKQIERDFVVKMVDLKRKHLEVDYMGALTDPIFDE